MKEFLYWTDEEAINEGHAKIPGVDGDKRSSFRLVGRASMTVDFPGKGRVKELLVHMLDAVFLSLGLNADRAAHHVHDVDLSFNDSLEYPLTGNCKIGLDVYGEGGDYHAGTVYGGDRRLTEETGDWANRLASAAPMAEAFAKALALATDAELGAKSEMAAEAIDTSRACYGAAGWMGIVRHEPSVLNKSCSTPELVSKFWEPIESERISASDYIKLTSRLIRNCNGLANRAVSLVGAHGDQSPASLPAKAA